MNNFFWVSVGRFVKASVLEKMIPIPDDVDEEAVRGKVRSHWCIKRNVCFFWKWCRNRERETASDQVRCDSCGSFYHADCVDLHSICPFTPGEWTCPHCVIGFDLPSLRDALLPTKPTFRSSLSKTPPPNQISVSQTQKQPPPTLNLPSAAPPSPSKTLSFPSSPLAGTRKAAFAKAVSKDLSKEKNPTGKKEEKGKNRKRDQAETKEKKSGQAEAKGKKGGRPTEGKKKQKRDTSSEEGKGNEREIPKLFSKKERFLPNRKPVWKEEEKEEKPREEKEGTAMWWYRKYKEDQKRKEAAVAMNMLFGEGSG